MIDEILKGTGCFVYSDPGGAKPILALAKKHMVNGHKSLVFTDRRYPFENIFGKINYSKSLNINDVGLVDFIFTGTSYLSSLEKEWLLFAKQNKIRSYSFVDHYTGFKDRFLHDGKWITPDIIFVISTEVVNYASKKYGISIEKFEVIGNPYFDYVKDWQPELSYGQTFSNLEIDFGKKNILYAPDPLSNVDGVTKFGFDEITATIQIFNCIEDILCNVNLLFKPHPNQKIEKMLEVLPENTLIVEESRMDNLHLMYYSDLIIGYFSNFLKEALLLNKNVLRYIPTESIYDPFSSEEWQCVNQNNLLKTIKQKINIE